MLVCNLVGASTRSVVRIVDNEATREIYLTEEVRLIWTAIPTGILEMGTESGTSDH